MRRRVVAHHAFGRRGLLWWRLIMASHDRRPPAVRVLPPRRSAFALVAIVAAAVLGCTPSKDDADFRQAKSENTPGAARRYQASWPDGRHAPEVEAMLQAF